MNREKFKTLTLVFLFFTSIILLFLNLNTSTGIVDFDKVYIKNIGVNNILDKIVKPQRILVHFGGGNHTEILDNKDACWYESKSILKDNLNKSTRFYLVDKSEYISKKSTKSVEIQFEKGVDGYFLAESMYLKDSSLSKYKNIYEILIPLVDDASIYFHCEDDKVYKINTKTIPKINFIDSIENKNYTKYYTVNDIFGISNDALIPIDIQKPYQSIGSLSYIDINNDKYVQELAKKIFREKYDFTNRIVENDLTNLFLYGYGEKSLRLDSTGYVEYFSDNSKDKDVDKDTALYICLDFLNRMDVNVENMILTDFVESKTDGKKVYDFYFSYVIGNLNLQTKLISPVSVKVVGDDVYSYKGIVKNPTTVIDEKINEHALTPQEILNMNFELLKENFGYSDGEMVIENLNSVELIYYLKENKFVPAWRFIIQGKEYIFDMYKGEILKYGLGKS